MNTTQPEFQGFPASQIETAAETVTGRFLRLTGEFGPLVPQSLLPSVLGVSAARVSVFLSTGRFKVCEINGQKFVPLDQAQSHRRLKPWEAKAKTV
jgi:hypothetical protein